MNLVKTAATFALALALHVFLGWQWTLAAGVVGGAWAGRRGWLVGAVGVGLDYLVLVLYSFVVASTETAIMAETLGGVFGGIGLGVLVLTVFIGVLLGGVGGALGMAVRGLFALVRTPAVD